MPKTFDDVQQYAEKYGFNDETLANVTLACKRRCRRAAKVMENYVAPDFLSPLEKLVFDAGHQAEKRDFKEESCEPGYGIIPVDILLPHIDTTDLVNYHYTRLANSNSRVDEAIRPKVTSKPGPLSSRIASCTVGSLYDPDDRSGETPSTSQMKHQRELCNSVLQPVAACEEETDFVIPEIPVTKRRPSLLSSDRKLMATRSQSASRCVTPIVKRPRLNLEAPNLLTEPAICPSVSPLVLHRRSNGEYENHKKYIASKDDEYNIECSIDISSDNDSVNCSNSSGGSVQSSPLNRSISQRLLTFTSSWSEPEIHTIKQCLRKFGRNYKEIAGFLLDRDVFEVRRFCTVVDHFGISPIKKPARVTSISMT